MFKHLIKFEVRKNIEIHEKISDALYCVKKLLCVRCMHELKSVTHQKTPSRTHFVSASNAVSKMIRVLYHGRSDSYSGYAFNNVYCLLERYVVLRQITCIKRPFYVDQDKNIFKCPTYQNHFKYGKLMQIVIVRKRGCFGEHILITVLIAF